MHDEKPGFNDDPEYWRDRASEARAMAELVADPENKRLMRGIAEGYDRLAQRAEERIKGR